MPKTIAPRALVLVVLGLVLAVLPPAAMADALGEYFPLWLGNAWTYENRDLPGDTYVDAVFELFAWEGQPAFKVGEPGDYSVVASTGLVITVFAEFADGELIAYDPPIVLGEYADGDGFEICQAAACDTNLIRDWEAVDPALRALYELDPAWDDLVMFASFDRDHPPNLHNQVAVSNLPGGAVVPAGAVVHLEWYQRDLGLVATADFDAASGGVEEFYELIDHVVGVDGDNRTPAAGVTLAVAPNPFNPRTVVTFTLPRATAATLAIHDLAGRRVRTFATGAVLAAGTHTLAWDGRDDGGRDQPSGTYHCVLTAGGEVKARRLTLVR